MAESFAFRISGVEPNDAAWKNASESLRREFWRAVVVIGLQVKDKELAQGLDRHGVPMIPISQYTREHRRSAMGQADPNAPALTPAYGLSRTRSLLTGRAHKNFAEFFWKYDEHTGTKWGKILGYHRKGSSRLPKRDVIGISPRSLTEVRYQAQIWWDFRKRGIILEQQVNQFQLPTPPVAMPAKIPVVGRTDFESFTFGINGDLQLVEEATKAGTFTGFRQFHPDGSVSAAGKPLPSKPTAAAKAHAAHVTPPKPKLITPPNKPPAPVIAPKPIKPFGASVTPPSLPPLPPADNSPRFKTSQRARDQKMRTVWVDVAAFDAAFQKDKGYAITRGGAGAIPGRLEGVKRFLKTGLPVEQPEVTIAKDGSVSFTNGRHRFAVLRDQGITKIPVSVPRGQVEKAKRLYGVDPDPKPRLSPALPSAPVAPLPSTAGASPASRSTAPILPGKPIQERIAAYSDGHEIVRQLQEIGSEAATLRQRATQLRTDIESLTAAYKAAPKGAAKREAKQVLDQATLEVLDVESRAITAEKEARAKAQFALDAPRRLQLGLTERTFDNLSPEQLSATQEGMRWLQRCVAQPEGQAPFTLNINSVPLTRVQRSACSRYFIEFSQTVDAAIAVHEIGHHFDYHMPGIDERAREFLAYRVGDEPLVPLREALKGKGKFGKDEVGRKDRFEEAFGDGAYYVGKAYDDGMTEITSMGLEQLFRDPVKFAQADPEYVVFLLGLMHGPLR